MVTRLVHRIRIRGSAGTHALPSLHGSTWNKLNNGNLRGIVNRSPDERVVVHIDKSGHENLTVETIDDTAVTGDHISKVLDFESTLETAGEESSERSDDRTEQRHGNRVDDERIRSHLQTELSTKSSAEYSDSVPRHAG